MFDLSKIQICIINFQILGLETMDEKTRRIGRLDKDKILFFQCDIQTFFKDYTYGMEGVINTAIMMAKASQVFEAPLIETE